jgi:hypothetical protein
VRRNPKYTNLNNMFEGTWSKAPPAGIARNMGTYMCVKTAIKIYQNVWYIKRLRADI